MKVNPRALHAQMNTTLCLAQSTVLPSPQATGLTLQMTISKFALTNTTVDGVRRLAQYAQTVICAQR
jgi:hypothetical protein